jgi:hypothetical protein
MNDVYERITLAYVWLFDPIYTKNINVRRSLREKIVTIYVYVTMYRSVLICVNYRVKHQYLTYRRVTLRNGHVLENKSIYRVYHVEWNSVIAALQRSDEWCRLPCSTQSREPRLHERLAEMSCCTELIPLSALHAQRHVTNTRCYGYILVDLALLSFYQKESRLAIHHIDNLKSQIVVLFGRFFSDIFTNVVCIRKSCPIN